MPLRKGRLHPSRSTSSRLPLTQQSAKMSAKPRLQPEAPHATLVQSQSRQKTRPCTVYTAVKQPQPGHPRGEQASSGLTPHTVHSMLREQAGPSRSKSAQAQSKGLGGNQQRNSTAHIAGELVHSQHPMQRGGRAGHRPAAGAAAAIGLGSSNASTSTAASAAFNSADNLADLMAVPATSSSLDAAQETATAANHLRSPNGVVQSADQAAQAPTRATEAGCPSMAALPMLQLPSNFRQALAGLRYACSRSAH